MTDTAKPQSPVDGTVNFIQHVLPGLDAGAYMLNVSQAISTQTAQPTNTYYFAVKGSRFALAPTDVFATYPPDMAVGEFNATLPHVVLTNRSLPWQRFPTLQEPDRSFPDHQHDRDVPSWLAVLLFDAGDEAAHPGFRAQARGGSVRELFLPRPGSDPQQGYSYFWPQADLSSQSPSDTLARHLEYGETPDDACQILDVPMALFTAIAPTCDDLKMTAHLRNVNIVSKATQNGVAAGRNDLSAVPGTSDFALVMGNRVPQAGVRTFAHLVSLEGLEPFLPSDPASRDDAGEVSIPTSVPGPNGFPIAPGGFMRLVSLRSWSFTSTGDNSQFENLLMALAPRNTQPATDFTLGLPVAPAVGTPSPAAVQARSALERGYTALAHHTRDGGQTVSWYRGPLVPASVGTGIMPSQMPSSDAATRYDPQSGMFDLSYAGAWQLGRLLALQDKRMPTLICNWRRQNQRDVVNRMEALVVRQSVGQILGQRQGDPVLGPLFEAFAPATPDVPALSDPQNAALPALLAVRSAGGLTATSRLRRATAHRSVLSDATAFASLMPLEAPLPQEVCTWLSRLKLLEGVPFRYLVPDEAMLPPESIRFFHLDVNWVHAMLDGALSIGRQGTAASPDAAHDTAMRPLAHRSASNNARSFRAAALGLPAPQQQPLQAVSGFLLRSDVVKGWPGLEVNGYAADGTLLDIVRFERLAPTVLICFFEKDGKTVHQVDIHEPAEGLHFGLSGGTSVNVRYNHAVGEIGAGSQVPGVYQPAPLRAAPGDPRVVRMFRLARDLLNPGKYGPYISGIYQGFDHLPSSQFAMQMLRGVGKVSFSLTGSAT